MIKGVRGPESGNLPAFGTQVLAQVELGYGLAGGPRVRRNLLSHVSKVKTLPSGAHTSSNASTRTYLAQNPSAYPRSRSIAMNGG